MSKMIQLRNVPEDLHRNLKAKAAYAGMSLSDFLLREIRKVAEQPTLGEIGQRLSERAPVETDISPAEAVRLERDAR